MVKYISVAGNTEVYDQLNELEYDNGFVYANVWQKPIILKLIQKSEKFWQNRFLRNCEKTQHRNR